MTRALCLALTLGASSVALAQSASALADRHETFGGVIAPAALPAGASSLYGFVGVPEIVGGYRQGLSGFELEARASFNYLALSFIAEAMAKVPVYRRAGTEVAPLLGFGFEYDTGSRYFDHVNFNFIGVRPKLGAVSTFRVSDVLRVIADVNVPWTISLSPSGGWKFVPLAGGGAEIYLGGDISAVVLGRLGLDAIKEPQGVAQFRVGYQVVLGIGLRLF